MADIVERLLAGRPTKFAGVVAHEPMDFEAADEIRRLRAEVELCKGRYEATNQADAVIIKAFRPGDEMSDMPDIVERLRQGVDIDAINETELAMDKAADEIERLRDDQRTLHVHLRHRNAMNDELRAKLAKYESEHA